VTAQQIRDMHDDIAAGDPVIFGDADGDDDERELARMDALELDEPATNGHGGGDHGDENHGEDGEELDESWRPVDLGPAVRGERVRPQPTILTRDDNRGLFYSGKVNGVHGDSGDGKSFAVLVGCVQEITAGRHVLWVDFEDDEDTIVERLIDLGADPDDILERFHYHRPAAPFDGLAVALIETKAREHDVTTIVLDSLGEAFGLEGIDEDRDVQVGPWLRRVARHLADATGAGVIIIDHSTKAKDNPLFPSGSKRKRAAITGSSYLIEAPRPLTREDGGKLRITCAKDRHGHYKRGDVVAFVEFTRYPDGGMTVHVESVAPRSADSASADEKLRTIARAAIRAAKQAERPLSGRELEALMNVKASATTKRAGIDYAVGEHSLKIERGDRRAVLHTYVRDLQDPQT
jgi:AAA domain